MSSNNNDDEITKSFMNFCRVRKEVLVAQYPNSSPFEIIRMLADEFNSLDALPPIIDQSFSSTRQLVFKFHNPN